MELWTEYEGRTIADAFPLKKLLRPEGRSAFFSTVNSKGVPTVIRLIESHFDEEEILARWRTVEGLNSPNLLKMEQYGQVVLDETPVVYAVMEPVEANLSEVLSQQRLTLPDSKQLVSSLLAALNALHNSGFVHEHVEPSNIFAVGEQVKLRSDCIRETPEGDEGRELKRRDLRDMSVVLLQALTQQKTLESAARDLPLPVPFDQIVRRGISGEWGASEIAAALQSGDRSVAPAAATPPSPRNTPVSPPPSSSTTNATPAPTPKLEPKPAAEPKPTPPSHRIRQPLEEKEIPSSAIPRFGRGRPGTGALIGLGVVVILILWLGWHMMHSGSSSQKSAPPESSQSAPVTDNSAHKPAAATPSAPAPTAQPKPAPAPPVAVNKTAEAGHGQWRVIAYTYNLEQNAQRKAAAIARKHPELHPEVFTPTGHTPYLISVGGLMSKDEAYALAKRARREGLPRDTFARNY